MTPVHHKIGEQRSAAHCLLLPRFSLFVLLLAGSAAHAAEAARSYYVEPGTYGTQRESDPPAYVANVGSTLKNSLTWLDSGAEYRLRY